MIPGVYIQAPPLPLYRPPPKIPNENRIRSQEQLQVLVNAFQIQHATLNHVFQFKLEFYGLRDQPNGQVSMQYLAKGKWNDEARETRRRLLWKLFNALALSNRDFFGRERRIFCFDCVDRLFCMSDLGLRKDQIRDFPSLDPAQIHMDDRCRSIIRRVNRIGPRLINQGEVSLRTMFNDVIRGNKNDVLQFLQSLCTQFQHEQENNNQIADIYILGNQSYKVEGGLQLQYDPHVKKTGMQKEVHFVGDNERNAQAVLLVDAKKTAFFPNIDLMLYLVEFFNMQHPQQLQAEMGRVFDAANKQVMGLSVHTTHLAADRQIYFVAAGLTNNPASAVHFQLGSVQEYFAKAHPHQPLLWPGMPCVIQKLSAGGMNFYPLEFVRIVEGQRVSVDKQSPRLVAQMIHQCQVPPVNLGGQIGEQLANAMIQNGNPYFQEHNVRCEPQLMTANARVLFPPAIKYHGNDRVEPERGTLSNWRTVGYGVPPRRQYAVAAEFPKRWAIVIVQNCVGEDECRRFTESYVTTARERGLAVAGLGCGVDHFTQTNMEYCKKGFEYYSRQECKFLLVFARGKREAHTGDIHHVLKTLEPKYSVLTQHISPEIMRKATRGSPELENILLKTNLKLGGVNYHLTTSNAFRYGQKDDTVRDRWLGHYRMFIGLDFSPAPPQSHYQSQAGDIKLVPMVVGMAYTLGIMATKMCGTYWYEARRPPANVQPPHSQQLVENLRKAVRTFEEKTGHLPRHLIVYRSGASDGEFKRINKEEGYALETLVRDLAAEYGERKFIGPALTIVVCQRSNYRMIPKHINAELKPPEQNVKPGTVVDTGVMSAAFTEFLLVAHRAQGTAKPVRCTVVYESLPPPTIGPSSSNATVNSRLALEELENITYTLCHGNGNFTGSTAVPSVLHSAKELSKRGRNNWKTQTQDGTGDQAEHFEFPQGADGQRLARAKRLFEARQTTYYGHYSRALMPKFETKFWA